MLRRLGRFSAIPRAPRGLCTSSDPPVPPRPKKERFHKKSSKMEIHQLIHKVAKFSRDKDFPRVTETLKRAMVVAKHIPQYDAKNLHTSYRKAILNCLPTNAIDRAVEILTILEKSGRKKFLPNSYTYTAMMSVASSAGRMDLVEKYFIEILKISKTVADRLAAYHSVLTACAKGKDLVLAQSIFEMLRKEDFRPDIVCFGSMLAVCQKTLNFEEGKAVWDEMKKTISVPNMVCYRTMLNLCEVTGKFSEGQAYFNSLKNSGHAGIRSTEYLHAIRLCQRPQDFELAFSYFEEMCSKRIKPTRELVSTLLAYAVPGMNYKHVLKIRELFPGPLNIYGYGAMMTIFNQTNQHQRAVDVFTELTEIGISPDPVIYCGLITAYGKLGQPDLAMKALETAKSHGLKPDLAVNCAVLQALAIAKRTEQVEEYFSTIPQPDSACFRILMGALDWSERQDRAEAFFTSIHPFQHPTPSKLACMHKLLSVNFKEVHLHDVLSYLMLLSTSYPDRHLYRAMIFQKNLSGRYSKIESYYRQGVEAGVFNPWKEPETTLNFVGFTPVVMKIALRDILPKWTGSTPLEVVTGEEVNRHGELVLSPQFQAFMHVEFPHLGIKKVSAGEFTILAK